MVHHVHFPCMQEAFDYFKGVENELSCYVSFCLAFYFQTFLVLFIFFCIMHTLFCRCVVVVVLYMVKQNLFSFSFVLLLVVLCCAVLCCVVL